MPLYDETQLFAQLAEALGDGALSCHEQACCKQLLVVFAQVEAMQPYKGLLTLLKRAMAPHPRHSSAYEAYLQQLVEEAKSRSEARVRLLAKCPLAAKKE